MEILLLLFGVMVILSAFKILVKLFWAIASPLASLTAVLIVLYLFSTMVGK